MIAPARPEPAITLENQVVNGENLVRLAEETVRRFHAAMNDDFDTPSAIAALFELARSINRLRSQSGGTEQFRTAQQTLVELSDILGLDLTERPDTNPGDAEPFIDLLIDIRAHLRQTKQWEAADRVRIGLQERGIALEDNPSGTTWKKI